MGDDVLYQVRVPARSIKELAPSIGADALRRVAVAGRRAKEALAGRRIIHINSTQFGGGAAEMLHELLPYVRAAGIDCRWLVLSGAAGFFAITKRIHDRVYGWPGDGGSLGAGERRLYEEIQRAAANELGSHLRPGDIVFVHDPQPLGLAHPARDLGAQVVWRCHIGTGVSNEFTDEGWSFLRPYLEGLGGYVFSRLDFAPRWLPTDRIFVIPPSINPASPKNRFMHDRTASKVMTYCGLRQGVSNEAPTFLRRNGTTAQLLRRADILQSGPPPAEGAPLIVQVSRWDRLKNMGGLMTTFANNLSRMADAHLALIGPAVSGTADDPSAVQVLLDCMSLWRTLRPEARARIHLACLPMADPEENAFIVNATQRNAAIVTQMSLAEGFGLTVAEAMWKGRAVIASRVGGIQDQIAPGSGVLVPPMDDAALATQLEHLLSAPERRVAMGDMAHERARSFFLPDRHLAQYAELVTGLCAT